MQGTGDQRSIAVGSLGMFLYWVIIGPYDISMANATWSFAIGLTSFQCGGRVAKDGFFLSNPAKMRPR
jgi:hypothetical protein